MSDTESIESAISIDEEVEELLKSADEMISSASMMITQLKIPDETELDRQKIWLEAKLVPEFSIFDLDTVFASLKEAACRRPTVQSWFAFMRWVFWG